MTKISTIEKNPAHDGPVSAGARRTEPDRNCPLCPRLVSFREATRAREPTGSTPPFHSFGDADARLAGRRPRAGHAGSQPHRPARSPATMPATCSTPPCSSFGFAKGIYQARPDDGLTLVDCRIGNAVHCVPPQNKPLPAEINTCRPSCSASIEAMPRLRAIVALGRIAHESTLKALGLRGAAAPFSHGATHQAGTASGSTTATIARATTPTPAC